jgi:hypothetical protein
LPKRRACDPLAQKTRLMITAMACLPPPIAITSSI